MFLDKLLKDAMHRIAGYVPKSRWQGAVAWFVLFWLILTHAAGMLVSSSVAFLQIVPAH